MQGIRVRRPLPWLLLSLLALLLPVSWGCNAPQSGSSTVSSTSSASEAERTRKMEEKAAEIERKSAEIQTMQGTEQEKIDAVNALEKERQELNAMQDAKP
jgi:hypothetical protein